MNSLEKSIHPDIAVHQCVRFAANPRTIHKQEFADA